MENQVNKSKYKVTFSEVAGRVAIIDKRNNEDVETFNDNVPEELLVQRMMEIRKDELRGYGTNGKPEIVTGEISPLYTGDIVT